MVNKTFGKHNIIFRFAFAFFAVSIMIFIFCMSAQNATQSSKTSGELILKLSKLLIANFSENDALKQQKIVEALQFIVRKTAHFLIYCTLGFNFCGFYSTFSFKKSKILIFSLLSSVFYAASDEFHQLFSVGRSAELRDIFIDSLGALLGISLFLLIVLFVNKLKGRKNIVEGQ